MSERTDLVETLQKHRFFLRNTTRELTDEQAARRTTTSELTLLSLIKHVADTERGWIDFVLSGPAALGGDVDPSAFESGEWEDTRFRIEPGETLAVLLERYDEVARRTDELAGSVDLDAEQPLPRAPWFVPGASWSARRVLLHVIAETSQHAGHADIIREALDGQKSMG